MANRGHARERQVKAHLQEQGWWVSRAAGSLGDADLVALRKDRTLRNDRRTSIAWMVEVKSNTNGGPFMNFRPADRKRLSEAAKLAGAEAVLAFWPPRKPLRFIFESSWPK